MQWRSVWSETGQELTAARCEEIAIRIEVDKCPGCEQYTQVFCLAKTHDDGEGER